MKNGRWDGGHIHVQKDGKRLFIIEKRRGGRKFHISTRTHSETAAYEHLKRFEADPWAYEQEMREGRIENIGVHLTADLVLEFKAWMLGRPRPATKKHANEMAHRLSDWIDDLGTRDLRRLDLGELKAMLKKRKTCRQHRVIALKAFMGWMRQEKHVVDRKDDVTLDLLVPQALPEKQRRRKAVPLENVRAALRELAPEYRDCLAVLAHLGMHVTELARFARSPESRLIAVPETIREQQRRAGLTATVAVVQVLHKTRVWTRSAISDEKVAEAARRIRDRGELPRRMNDKLKAACRAAGIPEFTFGVMRHSAGTWLLEAGNSAADVASFFDHASQETLLRHYADVGIPKVAVRQPELLD